MIVGNPAALFETASKRTPCSLCSASLCEGMHELGVGTISLKARTPLALCMAFGVSAVAEPKKPTRVGVLLDATGQQWLTVTDKQADDDPFFG